MNRPILSLLAVVLLPMGSARAQSLTNADFADGLTGWTTSQDGGTTGAVDAVATGAQLTEGDAFLVSLVQTFTMPPATRSLSFTVTPSPGFDDSAGGIPDAFEATLQSESGAPLVDAHRAGAASFFNRGEDGATRTGAGVTVSGDDVTVDVSAIPVGTSVTLAFHLVGGDDDTTSAITVGGVAFAYDNAPPTADAGPDQTGCAPASITLDGTGSTDPEGQPLTYAWTDDAGTPVGSGSTPIVTLDPGSHVLTLTVEDDVGHVAADTVTVVIDGSCPRPDAGVPGDDAGVPSPADGGGGIGVRDGGGTGTPTPSPEPEPGGTATAPCSCRALPAAERGAWPGALALLALGILGSTRRRRRA